MDLTQEKDLIQEFGNCFDEPIILIQIIYTGY